jgi:hypothetical protein
MIIKLEQTKSTSFVKNMDTSVLTLTATLKTNKLTTTNAKIYMHLNEEYRLLHIHVRFQVN